jgi:hypothetical protein
LPVYEAQEAEADRLEGLLRYVAKSSEQLQRSTVIDL